MDLKYGLVSVDDHVQEHPEVWTQRMSSSKWGNRIPHVEQTSDGTEYWVVDGQKLPLNGVAAVGATMPDRTEAPQRWADVPTMTYVADERLRAMDADGVDYSVLYPTIAGLAGETFGRITDLELELACVQAYNDWLIEEWTDTSERFVPLCLVPLFPIEETVKEIRRAVDKGHKGVVFPGVPMHLREVPHINEPDYDPLWATCQELQVPICFHAGSSTQIQFPAYQDLSPKLADALGALTRPVSSVQLVANFLYSRILMRFPSLKVVFAESSLGWGVYELETADHQFERQRLDQEGYDMTPSEMFHRQCYLTGWYDQMPIKGRHHIGVDNIMWSTNFPQTTSTWPSTRDYVTRSFQGVPEAERDKILWGNAVQLYKL
ncbi:MAG: amidohydrolase family protein [bacterium]|nr:amidohydrolase family protein [bacterium]